MADETILHYASIVEIRQRWGEPWVVAPWLDVLSLEWCLPPSKSCARLAWDFGAIRRAGEPVATAVPAYPSGLSGWYVRVRSEEADDLDWIGVVEESVDVLGGVDSCPTGTGRQEFTAFGLEHILAHYCDVDGSYILDGESAARVDARLPFNIRGGRGLGRRLQGNRSASRVKLPNGRTCYVFGGSDLWTAKDVLEYLLAAFGPKAPAVTLTDGVGAQNLDKLKDAWECRPCVADMFNLLARRQRGHAWSVAPASLSGRQAEDGLAVTIHSGFPEAITVGGATLQPGATPAVLDLDADDVLNRGVQEPQIQLRRGYGEIIVRGAPMLVCGSVRCRAGGDGTLTIGWDLFRQAEYDNVEERLRSNERYAGVYRDFVLSAEKGSELFDIGDNERGGPPRVTAGGEVDWSKIRTAAPIHLAGKTLCRQLPLQNDEGDPSDAEEFYKPLVFGRYKAPDGKYRYAALHALAENPDFEGGGAGNCHVTILPKRLGFRVTGSPHHLLGLNHFDGESARDPLLDYDELTAVVALYADTHLTVRAAVPNANALEFAAPLVVDCPGAQLWVLMPGTQYRVTGGGETLSGHPAHTGPHVLRNDKDKLLAIAAAAKAFYGAPRRAVTLGWSRIVAGDARLRPGGMIGTILRHHRPQTINSMVTSITWDFGRRFTTVRTDFLELELAAMFGADRGVVGYASPSAGGGYGSQGPSADSEDAPADVAQLGAPIGAKTGFWLNIVHEAEGGKGEYDQWAEQIIDAAGAWADKTGGRTHATTGKSVIEANQVEKIPIGSKVWVWVEHRPNGAIEYRFDYRASQAMGNWAKFTAETDGVYTVKLAYVDNGGDWALVTPEVTLTGVKEANGTKGLFIDGQDRYVFVHYCTKPDSSLAYRFTWGDPCKSHFYKATENYGVGDDDTCKFHECDADGGNEGTTTITGYIESPLSNSANMPRRDVKIKTGDVIAGMPFGENKAMLFPLPPRVPDDEANAYIRIATVMEVAPGDFRTVFDWIPAGDKYEILQVTKRQIAPWNDASDNIGFDVLRFSD